MDTSSPFWGGECTCSWRCASIASRKLCRQWLAKDCDTLSLSVAAPCKDLVTSNLTVFSARQGWHGEWGLALERCPEVLAQGLDGRKQQCCAQKCHLGEFCSSGTMANSCGCSVSVPYMCFPDHSLSPCSLQLVAQETNQIARFLSTQSGNDFVLIKSIHNINTCILDQILILKLLTKPGFTLLFDMCRTAFAIATLLPSLVQLP